MASIRACVATVTAWFLFLLIESGLHRINGDLIISPSPKAAVCQGGDSLEVTCTTSDHFLTWILTKSGSTDRITRTLSSTIRNSEIVVVNSTVFAFLRTSELGSTPLISTLKIGSVSQILNGTKIVCTEVGASAMTANTTVYVIRNKHVYHPKSPKIVITKEDFGVDEVIVSLEWLPTQELIENSFESLVSYNVSIKPSVGVEVVMIDATRVNLTIPYNTLYNMSVTASFCDQINTSLIIELTYANCGNPLDQNQLNNSNVQAIGNSSLEGDGVILFCPFGLEINGSNVSICMGNGKWEPDPGKVECLAIESEMVMDVLQTGSDEFMNLSHTIDFHFSTTRKNHHETSVEIVIGITVTGVVGVTILFTIMIVAVAMIKRIKLKDNDNEPLVNNIHLERVHVHFNQELHEKDYDHVQQIFPLERDHAQ